MKKYKNNKSYAQNDILAVFVNAFLIGIFVILPLIFTDYYFNILGTKWVTLAVLMSVLIVFSLPVILSEKGFKSLIDKNTGNINLNLSSTDICILIFITGATIGTLCSYPYIEQAFLGYEGRYNGLFAFLLYTITYFIVSRNYKFSKKIFDYLLIAGALVCLFGITDYFNLNIMGFKNNMRPDQMRLFASTIGNINSYTGYIAYILSVSGVLYITTPLKINKYDDGEDRFTIARYYVIMLISFFAITMGNSDNGYLTLGAFFAITPLFIWKNMIGVKRYFVTIATYITTVFVIDIINKSIPDKVIGISGLYDFIADFKYLPHIACILWIIVAALYFSENKLKLKENIFKIMRISWCVLLGLVVIGGIYLIVRVNTAVEPPTGGIYSYLLFNDSWGTNRGYVWRAALEEYSNLSFIRKIFGSGPDTFGIYMHELRYADMVKTTGQYFDAVHNEYIQYLFTHGLVGLMSYIGIIVSVILGGIKVLKNMPDNEEISRYIIACIMLIICYSTQAVVNLSIPTVSPIFFIFIMILSGIIRSKEKPNV